MTLDNDFEDFVALLNKHGVDYMIVGGYALAFHGKPRHTGDLDIWIDISDDNAKKLVSVLNEFGMASLGMKKEDFLQKGGITQIGYPPLRIDILNEIDGVKFKEAYINKLVIDIDGLVINYIGLHDLIKNKQASGRYQDISDVNELNKLKNK
ncbi:MAG: nucleotidyltransferase [Sphingobacteriales bacterium]